MQIQKTNNVQFGAKFISPATIKVKVGKRWKDAQVNFIKFDTSKQRDVSALEGVEALWGRKNLSSNVLEEAHILGGRAQVYAVTTQESDFDVVDARKILGLMSTDKIKKGKPEVEIFKIGTNPAFAYAQKKRKREVRHIATSMYEAFQNLASKSKAKPIVTYIDPEDTKFLAKLGVEPKSKNFVDFLG